MKITIAQHDLNSALSAVARAMSGRTTMPVLSGIYLEAEGSMLTVRATDMAMFIEKRVPCSAHLSGTAVIAGKALCDLVRRIPNGDVSITVGDNCHAVVRWGKSEYNIPGFLAKDYPQVPKLGDAETFSIGQAELKRLLQRTVFATTQDADKPYLGNVVLTLKAGKLAAQATDGTRIACAEERVEHNADAQTILGARAVAEIGRLLAEDGEATVSFAANHAAFANGTTRITTARIEAQPIDVSRHIGFLGVAKIAVNRSELLEVIDRLTAVAGDGLWFNLCDNGIRLTQNTKDAGHCEEAVPAGAIDGEPIEIGLNGKYVADYLKVLEDAEVRIECAGVRAPVRFVPVGDAGSIYVMAQMLRVAG